MTLGDAFDNFILDKTLQNLSDDTIQSYRNLVSIFVNHVGKDCSLDSICRKDVDSFILSLRKQNLSKATVATYIRNARIFLRWISEEFTLSFDPTKIKVPKTPKKKVHLYNNSEIHNIFEQLETSIPWITQRNKVIIALMFDSGIRQIEVCTLLRKDLDFERNVIKVTGKGAKERYVPLGEFSKVLLQQYLDICPYENSDSVFLTRTGTPMTRNAVRIFVNRLKHQTEIDISSHKFRHNFATNFCLDNLKRIGSSNVYDLSILMGHESIETTKKYEHFAHELVAISNCNSHLDMVFEKSSMSEI